MDSTIAYQHAFTYIRELAVMLRKALNEQSKVKKKNHNNCTHKHWRQSFHTPPNTHMNMYETTHKHTHNTTQHTQHTHAHVFTRDEDERNEAFVQGPLGADADTNVCNSELSHT